MKRFTTEVLVGLFMLIGFLCFIAFAIKFGSGKFFNEENYELVAMFDSISGLRVGAPVEIAGVMVGKVVATDLNIEENRAEVRLLVRQGISIDEDAVAGIRTKGLIGEKYIKIILGGAEDVLGPGEEIFETEPSIEIEEVIGKFIYKD